jgi:hypothetical protein
LNLSFSQFGGYGINNQPVTGAEFMNKHLLGQIGGAIGFLSFAIALFSIFYTRITQDCSKGFFSRPDSKAAAIENRALWIALVGGGVGVALLMAGGK